MEYSKLVAVSGLPGLFELINSKTDGAIVRSLTDKTTRFVSNRIHQFSHLESIEVYTQRENVNLVEIFQSMEKSGNKLPDDKDADGVRKYFEKAYPELDFERVYPSDMKKMVKWFDILQKNKIELKLSEPEEEEAVEEEVAVEEAPAPKKAAKKQESPEADEKPAKKTASKTTSSKTAKKDDKSPGKKSASKKK